VAVPFVTTLASVDLTAPASTPASAYPPSRSLMFETSENFPRPSSIFILPNVIPPPFTVIATRIDWPLSQVMVPVPFAVL